MASKSTKRRPTKTAKRKTAKRRRHTVHFGDIPESAREKVRNAVRKAAEVELFSRPLGARVDEAIMNANPGDRIEVETPGKPHVSPGDGVAKTGIEATVGKTGEATLGPAIYGEAAALPIRVTQVRTEYTYKIGEVSRSAAAQVTLDGAQFLNPKEISAFVNAVQSGIALPIL